MLKIYENSPTTLFLQHFFSFFFPKRIASMSPSPRHDHSLSMYNTICTILFTVQCKSMREFHFVNSLVVFLFTKYVQSFLQKCQLFFCNIFSSFFSKRNNGMASMSPSLRHDHSLSPPYCTLQLTFQFCSCATCS